ncbi:hypothetical protein HK405_013234, partial [Cladochytrium tenue]
MKQPLVLAPNGTGWKRETVAGFLTPQQQQQQDDAAQAGKKAAGTGDANPLYKTRLCERFETDGTCPYGSRCTFAHGAAELRDRSTFIGGADAAADTTKKDVASNGPAASITSGPDGSLYKTRMCENFTKEGFCQYGPRCNFAHSAAELRERVRSAAAGPNAPTVVAASAAPAAAAAAPTAVPLATPAVLALRPGGAGIVVAQGKPKSAAQQHQHQHQHQQGGAGSNTGKSTALENIKDAPESVEVVPRPAVAAIAPGSTRGQPAKAEELDGFRLKGFIVDKNKSKNNRNKKHVVIESSKLSAAQKDLFFIPNLSFPDDGDVANSSRDSEEQSSSSGAEDGEDEGQTSTAAASAAATNQSAAASVPRPTFQTRGEEAVAGELGRYFDGGLAAPRPVAVETKEVTRLEFRHDLTKQQLFHVLVAALLWEGNPADGRIERRAALWKQ